MLVRTLMCSSLFLAACVPEGGPSTPEPEAVFSDLPGDLRVEARWSDFYQQATIYIHYGPAGSTWNLPADQCNSSLEEVTVDVTGGRSVLGFQPGSFSDGCEPPHLVVDRTDASFEVVLTDLDGETITMGWKDLDVQRAWQFDTDILHGGDTVRLGGLLPNDQLSAQPGEALQVTLAWLVDLHQERRFVDGIVVGNDVEFVVPEDLAPGYEISGIAEGPVYAENTVCDGAVACRAMTDSIFGASAVAAAP